MCEISKKEETSANLSNVELKKFSWSRGVQKY